MGCDIHAIFEVKQNGKWCYVPDLPDEFEDRCYGFFAMLNRSVRNSLDIKGFVGKGLPDDIAGMHYRFHSQRGELERTYFKRSTQYCYVNENELYSVFDERLTRKIDEDLFEHLMDGMTEEETQQYYLPRRRERGGIVECVVQDASLVGGTFTEVPFTMIYKDLSAFNDAYYKYKWVEEYQDFGYFEVDFESEDYHSHSYLTLKELLTKVKDVSAERTYEVPSAFIEDLLESIDYLPDTFVVLHEDINKGVITLGYNEDCEMAFIQKMYNDAIEKVKEIKKKYGIKNNEDVRVIFAFDS